MNRADATRSRPRPEDAIFVIGVPRSGTTVIYEALSGHEDLGWPSQFSARFPARPEMNVCVRLFDNRFWCLRGRRRQGVAGRSPADRFLPRPVESYAFWEHYCGPRFRRHYLLGETAGDGERRRLQQVVARTLSFQGKKRFIAKLTGPGRIGYLAEAFPAATFIHVLRDGRAVANSLLNVGFWKEGGGLKRPWWENGFKTEHRTAWERSGRAPLALAALQWRNIIERNREESLLVAPERYLEVRYEDFVADPHARSKELLEGCGLIDSKRVHRYLRGRGRLHDMNRRYRAALTSDDLALLDLVIGDTLRELGYQ